MCSTLGGDSKDDTVIDENYLPLKRRGRKAKNDENNSIVANIEGMITSGQ